LSKKFKLKHVEDETFHNNANICQKLCKIISTYPSEINCLLVENYYFPMQGDCFDTDNISVINHQLTQKCHIFYNQTQELSEKQILEITYKWLTDSHTLIHKKFSFRDTSEMKNFIIRNQPN
jgi:hypothetical protein